MSNPIKHIRPAAKILSLLLFGIAITANALADNYRVKIKKIGPDSETGDITIQVAPGKNEKKFTGKARVMLIGTDPGTNRAFATLLTAVSLNTEVLINVANPPTNYDIQVITNTTLIAP